VRISFLKAFVIALVLTLTPTVVASTQAAAKALPKPIVVKPLSPTLDTTIDGGNDLTGILLGAHSINIVGTLETSTASIVTSAPLGGSDGYVVNVDSAGRRNWDIRLGTPYDDVAMALSSDAKGNIWVVGATVIGPTESLSKNSDQEVQKTSGLQRIVVWEVSPTGTLLNTYSTDFSEVAAPTSITTDKSPATSLTISGVVGGANTRGFTMKMSAEGKFMPVQYSPNQNLAPSSLFSVKSSLFSWQSFVTSRGIEGVSGFKPKVPTSILMRYSRKTGGIVNVYSLPGSVSAMSYTSTLGLVLVTNDHLHSFLTIIHSS
jgi:hypothetical protein